ncbi:LOW QUALITY PROTEIN: hypothetical protein V2J09_003401 [Rumex salicifolius]
MKWYRRSKLAWGVIRNAAIVSKVFARNPLPLPNSIKISPLAHQWKMGFSSSSLLSSRFGQLELIFLILQEDTTILTFTTLSTGVTRKLFDNPRDVFIAVLLGSGCVIAVYIGNLETIPYTKRTHLVLLSKKFEKSLGNSLFKQIKDEYKGKLLPAIHPDSVRVRLIANDVMEAVHKGISHEFIWSDSHRDYGFHENLKPGDLGKEDEILDDEWVEASRKNGEARGAQPTTKHLEHVNWEVVVVDDPVINAFCLPGGKIVVFTGLLREFTTDAEIATVIGHEFVTLDVVKTMSKLLLKLPFSRKMEIEADYIGLLLTASAVYELL